MKNLKQKLHIFWQDPFWTLKGKIPFMNKGIQKINRLLQIWPKYQLQKRGYLKFMENRPPPAYEGDYADSWFLYRTVRRRKPRCIFEFGSGTSTVIFAQALYDNYLENPSIKGYLYSLDAEKEWVDVTAKSIPVHLRTFCEVNWAPVRIEHYDGIQVYRHLNVPNIVPDLVYLDDPTMQPKNKICVDMLDVENRLVPGFYMIIDGRREMTEFLRKHLKRNYKFRYRRFFFNSAFELVQ